MPVRTCIGCRRQAPASELVRVVAGPEGSLLIGSNLAGRGAWLCARSLECLRSATRRNAFSRALRTTVASDAATDLEAHFTG